MVIRIVIKKYRKEYSLKINLYIFKEITVIIANYDIYELSITEYLYLYLSSPSFSLSLLEAS